MCCKGAKTSHLAALFVLYDDFAVFLVTPYSEALKDIRMSIGMSQRAFAEHIGVIPSYYYKLESGAS